MNSFNFTVAILKKKNTANNSYQSSVCAFGVFPQRSIYHKHLSVYEYLMWHKVISTNMYDLPNEILQNEAEERKKNYCHYVEAHALQTLVILIFVCGSSPVVCLTRFVFTSLFRFVFLSLFCDCCCFACHILMAQRSFSQEWVLAFRLFARLLRLT